MPGNTPSVAPERKKVAEALHAGRDRIVADWMKAVASDDEIPSADRLTMTALEDHFPEMLAELEVALRDGLPQHETGAIRRTARAHGNGRWQQGYRLDEILRELTRVRKIVLKELDGELEEQRLSAATGEEIRQTTGYFFDTIAAESAQEFVRAQKSEVFLRTQQLEHTYEMAHVASAERRTVEQSRLRLLRAVNHELRNALHPVALAAYALLRETDVAERRSVGTELERVAVRLGGLLDRLQKYSALLAGETPVQWETVDVRKLLDGLDEEYRHRAHKKGLQFACRKTGKLPAVTSDWKLLHEVGSQLLSNAIEFTAAGFVDLTVTEADGGRWTLRVADSGPGMGPLVAKQIFSEFHLHDVLDHPSIHLGLVISRHIAHLLGGEITFRTTPGEGSTFEVSLPISAGQFS